MVSSIDAFTCIYMKDTIERQSVTETSQGPSGFKAERKRRPVERFDESSSFLEIEEEGRRSLSRKTSQALHDHCIRVSTQNKLFMLHRLSILSFYTIFCLWVALHSWLRSRNHFASFSARKSASRRLQVEQEEWLDGWMHVDSHSFPFTFIHVLPVKSVINET